MKLKVTRWMPGQDRQETERVPTRVRCEMDRHYLDHLLRLLKGTDLIAIITLLKCYHSTQDSDCTGHRSLINRTISPTIPVKFLRHASATIHILVSSAGLFNIHDSRYSQKLHLSNRMLRPKPKRQPGVSERTK